MFTNAILRAIDERRSIRAFENKELTQDEIELLRQAVLAVPTAMNLQELKYSFILDTNIIEEISQAVIKTFEQEKNQEALERIRGRHTSVFYGAPLVITISAPAGNSYSDVNAGIAVQTLALAAQGMGLGSCIIGMAKAAFSGSKARKCKELARIPADCELIISIAIGHATISKEAHDLRPDNITFIRKSSN